MAHRGLAAQFDPAHRKIEIYLYSVLVGVASGFIIVAYRKSIHGLESLRLLIAPVAASGIAGALLWLALALVLGLCTALMVKRAPLIRGSGIPQIKAGLMRRIGMEWKKELPFKFLGGSFALGAGLSLGREGPSIQLGALTGAALSDLSGKLEIKRFLVTAGAAAGISAAFNAPLAGVLFCIEELHRNVSPIMLTSALLASFAANAVMWAFFGSAPVFGLAPAEVLPFSQYFTTILMVGLAAGLLGGVFNRGLLGFQAAYRRLVPNGTARLLSAFGIAAAVSMLAPMLAGGGDGLIASLVELPRPLWLLSALLAGKLLFTLFSYASGAPGGIFLPMLALGGTLGAMANVSFSGFGLEPHYLQNFILLGMVGFFTAVVRAPITGAVLVTEMAGSFAHFPAFIFVSLIAALISGIIKTKPIYDSLLAQLTPEHPSATLSRPIILHIPVQEGSILDTCPGAQKLLPEGCILAGVEHGERELFPAKDLDIQPGDVLRIIVESDKAYKVKEELLRLAEAADGHGLDDTEKGAHDGH
jgi:H+/Cl- antiporter ClcA